MDYAIIESGSKQYKVSKGTVIDVELLDGADKGTIDLDKVLLISGDGGIKIGMPYIKGSSVKCKVVEPDIKDVKVTSFKYKNKTGYHRTKGHRQRYTRLEVENIVTA